MATTFLDEKEDEERKKRLEQARRIRNSVGMTTQKDMQYSTDDNFTIDFDYQKKLDTARQIRNSIGMTTSKDLELQEKNNIAQSKPSTTQSSNTVNPNVTITNHTVENQANSERKDATRLSGNELQNFLKQREETENQEAKIDLSSLYAQGDTEKIEKNEAFSLENPDAYTFSYNTSYGGSSMKRASRFAYANQNIKSIEKSAEEEAKEINQLVNDGKYVQAYTKTIYNNAIGGGMQSITGLMNAVNTGKAFITKGIAAGYKLSGNEKEAKRINAQYDALVKEGSDINKIGNFHSTATAMIEDDTLKTAGNVTSTISRQLMDYATSLGFGFNVATGVSNLSGSVIQGVGVLGSSSQEVLDDGGNILQAVATGTTKGYIAKKLEDLFESSILTRGFHKSSIEKQVTKFISKTFKTEAGKELASRVTGNVGENIEEFLEDNFDMLIDFFINNKDLPSFEEWWNNTTETAKITTLSTFLMQLMGLGGDSFRNKEIALSNDTEFWAYEAQKFIDKGGYALQYTTDNVVPENNRGTFYSVQYNSDGEIVNTTETQGKPIDNPNKNVNISPVIIRNEETGTYNIIDGNTGVMMDSSPYITIIQAEAEFNNKMINLDEASIKGINNKINQANIAINNKINAAILLATDKLKAIEEQNNKNNATQTSQNQSESIINNQTSNYTSQNGNMVAGQNSINEYKSKSFDKDIERFKSKNYNENDSIVILDETPQYLYNKGYEYNQPIVINMQKLETIMKEPKGTVNGKNQHGITMDLIEQLPQALSNPLNVIKNPKYNNRYIVVTELTDQYGDIVIVPVEMNTKGYIQGIETDVNRISSIYGKENYDTPKRDEVDSYMEQNKENIVYDVDTYKNSNNIENHRLHLPSTNNDVTTNNSIPQANKIVKGTTNKSMQNNKNYTSQNVQNGTRANQNNQTSNYTSQNESTTASQNGASQNNINEILNSIKQIPNTSTYTEESAKDIINTVAQSVPGVQVIEQSGDTYINSMDNEGNVVYQQKLPAGDYSGRQVKSIVNKAIKHTPNSAQMNLNNQTSNNTTQNKNTVTSQNSTSQSNINDTLNITKYIQDTSKYTKELTKSFFEDLAREVPNISVTEQNGNIYITSFDNNKNITYQKKLASKDNYYGAEIKHIINQAIKKADVSNEINNKGGNENVEQERSRRSTHNGQETSGVQERENARGEGKNARSNELVQEKQSKGLSNYQKQKRKEVGKDFKATTVERENQSKNEQIVSDGFKEATGLDFSIFQTNKNTTEGAFYSNDSIFVKHDSLGNKKATNFKPYHEFGHWLKNNRTEQWQRLYSIVDESITKKQIEDYRNVLNNKSIFENMTDEQMRDYIINEIVSDYVGNWANDVMNWQNYLSDISKQYQDFLAEIALEEEYVGYNVFGSIEQQNRMNEAITEIMRDVIGKDNTSVSNNQDVIFSNRKADVIFEKDGKFNRVKINEDIFANNTNGNSISKIIHNYLTQHIGEYYYILESGQKVYLGQDLPNEYVYSKSSQNLTRTQKMAKGRAASGLKEIIENATNKQYQSNKKKKHNIDGKYGFYKYDTTFSFDHNGKEQIYKGTILIRNDADGKKYLYDIIGIKKIGNNLPLVASNSQKSSAIVSGSNFLPTNSITSSNKNVNSATATTKSIQNNKNYTSQNVQNGTRTNQNNQTSNYTSQNESTVTGQNEANEYKLKSSDKDIENFSKQVDEVLIGTFPKNDMLTLLSETPQPLIEIGLTNLPITMTQKHLKTIMNDTGSDKNVNYHGLGIDIVKQLPEAINNPLDIVQSNTRSDSVVLTTYLADSQDRTIIASIRINGKGQINNIEIDTNVMTSAYGRNNYDKFMEENLKKGNLLYDIDRGVIKKVDMAKLQLPRHTNSTTNSSSINSIPQANKIVKGTTNQSIQNTQNNTNQIQPSDRNDIDSSQKTFQDIILRNKNLNSNSKIPVAISNETINTTKSNSIRLQNDFKNNVKNGEYKNKATDYTLNITSETKSKIINPTKALNKTRPEYILRMIAANNLPELFENAVYIDTLPVMKGKGGEELGYHHFVAPIDIDGQIYRVLLTGKEKLRSKKIYSLNIEILQNNKGLTPRASKRSSLKGANPYTINIADLTNNVNIYDYDNQKWITYNSSDLRFSNRSDIDNNSNQNYTPEQQEQNKKIQEQRRQVANMLKERSFYKNVNNSDIPTQFREELEGHANRFEYMPVSNAETLSKVLQKFNNNDLQKLTNLFFQTNTVRSAEDTAMGEVLISKHLEAGNYDTARELTINLAQKLTEAGQAVQAASMLKRMTPSGMVAFVNNQINNINKELEIKYRIEKNLTSKNAPKVELTDDMIQFINEKMQYVQELENQKDQITDPFAMEDLERQQEIAIQQIMSKIGENIPSNMLDKLSAWRNISLLCNPKTIARNAISNVAFTVMADGTDALASVLDRAVSHFTGQRSIKAPDVKTQLKGMKKGFNYAVEDTKLGISTSLGGNKYNIKPTTTFKNRALQVAEKVTYFGVEGMDRPFMQAHYDAAIKMLMELEGLEYGKDMPTEAIKQEALDIANYNTFKDNNAISKGLSKFKKFVNANQSIGAADVLGLTYTNIPGNLTKKAIDYSPMGLYNVFQAYMEFKEASKNGEQTRTAQRHLVQATSRVLIGTGIMAVSIAAALAGVLTASGDNEDDKIKELLGQENYAINVNGFLRWITGGDPTPQNGDHYITYSNYEPVSSMIASAAEMAFSAEEGNDPLTMMYKGLTTWINSVTNLSVLDNFSNLFQYGDLGGTLIRNLAQFPASFIPTVSKQIAQFLEPNSKSSYSDSYFERYIWNPMRQRIPGLYSTMESSYDTMGEEKESFNGSSGIGRVFNVFLNTSFTSTVDINETEQELYDLYLATGSTDHLPVEVSNYFTYRGQKINLTAEEKAEYQKRLGEETAKAFKKEMQTSEYQSMSDEEKVKALSSIINDLKTQIRGEVVLQPRGLTYDARFSLSNSYLSLNGYRLDLTDDMRLEYEKLASNQYNQYVNQGICSEEKLKDIASKCKDYAKKVMMQKYRSSLVKSK